jgi:hypothetical protein
MEWKPIETAPKDGTAVRLKTTKGHKVNARWVLDGDYEGWWATDEGKHPKCWSDGGCWQSNADEVPSAMPIGWRPLPPTSAETPQR